MAAEDARLSRGDIGILARLVKRFRKSNGNAWASHDMLAEQANLTKRQVIRSVQRLSELGYVSVARRGVRGRSSVYVPSFNLVLGDTDVTKTLGDADVTLSGGLGDTDVTALAVLGDTDVTPSHLPQLADKATLTESDSWTTALPPADVGPSGPPRSAAPLDGYEEFYIAYGVRRNKAKGRAIYDELAPSPELHSEIILAAGRWRNRYDETGREANFRKGPDVWLREERWDEDGPEELRTHEKKAKVPAATETGLTDGEATEGSHRAMAITQTEIVEMPGGGIVVDLIVETLDRADRVDFRLDLGKPQRDDGPDLEFFDSIRAAAGVGHAEGVEALLSRPFLVEQRAWFFRFAPVSNGAALANAKWIYPTTLRE